MSIYATLWILKFPAFGDAYSGCDWVNVFGQGVPGHIGTPTEGYGYEAGDPYSTFLPPAIVVTDDDDIRLRAVVIVRERTDKVGQQYVDPLLVFSGTEYDELSFQDLHDRICDSLRGGRPRVVAELFTHGESQLLFEDGLTASSPDTQQPASPEGWHAVTPRIVVHGAERLVMFIQQVFGASGEYQPTRPSELRIGDSIILISDAGTRNSMTAFLYVYTKDCDATYRTALRAGARSIEEPFHTPYGDRRCMVEDQWGNTWQIATHARPNSSN
jgi:PhnB protein